MPDKEMTPEEFKIAYAAARAKAIELPVNVGVMATVESFLKTISNLDGLLELIPPNHIIYDDLASIKDVMENGLAGRLRFVTEWSHAHPTTTFKELLK